MRIIYFVPGGSPEDNMPSLVGSGSLVLLAQADNLFPFVKCKARLL